MKEFSIVIEKSRPHDIRLFGLTIIKRKQFEVDFGLNSDAVMRSLKQFSIENQLEINMRSSASAYKRAQFDKALELDVNIGMAKFSNFLANDAALKIEAVCETTGIKSFGSMAQFKLLADGKFYAEKHAAGSASLEFNNRIGFEIVRTRRLGDMRRVRLGEFDPDILDQVDHIAL